MAITREEVLHVAKLARLELTDDEVERLTGQLSAILEAVSKVSELDLARLTPEQQRIVVRLEDLRDAAHRAVNEFRGRTEPEAPSAAGEMLPRVIATG